MRSRRSTPKLLAALAPRSAAPGADRATVAHRLEPSGPRRSRHVRLYESMVGWDGAGSEKAIHRFELVRTSTGPVDRRSRALAARSRRGSRLGSVRMVVFAPSQRDEYALCLREDSGWVCLDDPARHAPPLPPAGCHLRRWLLPHLSPRTSLTWCQNRHRRHDRSTGDREPLRLSRWRPRCLQLHDRTETRLWLR